MSGGVLAPIRASRSQPVEAPFSRAMLDLAVTRGDVVVLAADLSKYTDVHEFAQTYPERFLQIGMAEQNLMGVAAGIAKAGLLPVITTYCVFASRRSYEQVALALCTGRRPAVIAAFLPGITTPFRATHQGTDDLALMRNIPGITVIDPMDATDVAAALTAAVNHDGVVYLRGLRGQVDRYLDPEAYRFKIGATHQLTDGGDVGIVATGLGTQWALQGAERLADQGIHAAVLHVPTVKPLDTEAVLSFCEHFPVTLTVENHARTGGLGSAVAEILAEAGSHTRLRRLGIPDQWPPAGSLDFIRLRLGLDADGIASSVSEALRGQSAGDHR